MFEPTPRRKTDLFNFEEMDKMIVGLKDLTHALFQSFLWNFYILSLQKREKSQFYWSP